MPTVKIKNAHVGNHWCLDSRAQVEHDTLTDDTLWFCFVCTVRVDLLDVRQTSVPADHVQSGHISPAVQRDPVLGHHRDMSVAEHIQEDQHTEENDQIGHVVSDDNMQR